MAKFGHHEVTVYKSNDVPAGRVQSPPPEECEPLVFAPDGAEQFAWRLARAYQREETWRAVRLGEVPKNNQITKLKPAWRSLARRLRSVYCFEPERFMHAQWLNSVNVDEKTLSHGPFPNGFDNEAAVQRYTRYAARADQALQTELESNTKQFQFGVFETAMAYPQRNTKQIWDLVLRNKVYDMSPLFRFSVSIAEKLFEVAGIYRDEAVQQLLTDPAGYMRTWGKLIPDKLKQDVELILQTTL